MKHYVGEAGTDLIFDCGVLVNSATDKFIKYKDPSGLIGTWSASFYSSTSVLAGNLIGTYFLKHTLVASDFSIPGDWRFQSYLGAVDGTWFGENITYTVYDKFQ